MDALKSLYDSQVSEDEAVEVLQCSQQYDEAIDLDEGAFRVVNVAPIDHEAPRRIEDIVPGQLPNNHQWLAVDLLKPTTQPRASWLKSPKFRTASRRSCRPRGSFQMKSAKFGRSTTG